MTNLDAVFSEYIFAKINKLILLYSTPQYIQDNACTVLVLSTSEHHQTSFLASAKVKLKSCPIVLRIIKEG